MSSDASGYTVGQQWKQQHSTDSSQVSRITAAERTLASCGLNNIKNVSSTTLIVSTSPTSLFKLLMSPLRAPEATEAGYVFAKLLSPRIAARRSSSSVALCRRLLRVLMVSVAVCLAGACDSRMRNIVLQVSHILEVSLYYPSSTLMVSATIVSCQIKRVAVYFDILSPSSHIVLRTNCGSYETLCG